LGIKQTPKGTMTTQTKDPQTKPLCELEGCPSIASKTIDIRPVIDRFVSDTHKDNPEANILCIKRVVSKLLIEESARLFADFMESRK